MEPSSWSFFKTTKGFVKIADVRWVVLRMNKAKGLLHEDLVLKVTT